MKQAKISKYTAVKTFPALSSVPDDIADTISLVEKGGMQHWAILQCPCGCGLRISLNLNQSRYPFWEIQAHRGTVSIIPSIWVGRMECGSHFWIVRNKVRWFKKSMFDRFKNITKRFAWWRIQDFD